MAIVCFLFLKKIISVLRPLRDNLLLRIHWQRCFESWFTNLLIFFRDLSVNRIFVSSEKWCIDLWTIDLWVIQKVSSLRRGGGRSLKSEQKRTGGGGFLACMYVCFFKKNAEIFKMKFYSHSPVFSFDYNGSITQTNHHERL